MPTGIYKRTEEHKRKISESLKGHKVYGGDATRFKKGHIPKNKGIGHSRFTLMKKAKATLEEFYGCTWEEMNLPLDPVIHHIDKNRENYGFDNLCIMTRSDHMKHHNEGGQQRWKNVIQ